MALTGIVTEDWSGQTTLPGNPDTGRWTIQYESSGSYLNLETKDAATRLTSLGNATCIWYYSDQGAWASDLQSIEIDAYFIGSGAGSNITLGLRHTPLVGSNGSGYYLMWCKTPDRAPTANSYRIVRKTNQWPNWGSGYTTELATYNGADLTAGDTLRFESYLNGDLKAYVNGVEIMSVNDTTHTLGYPLVGSNDGNSSATGSQSWFNTLVFSDRFLGGGLAGTGLDTGLHASWNRNIWHP